MSNSCFWVLGRGASIANGLNWAVPEAWNDELTSSVVTRDEVVAKIKKALRHEIAQSNVHRRAYRCLIEECSRRTSNGWYHRFLTTNWDTLLEEALLPHASASVVVPTWLGMQSHVFHLNGTIEDCVGGLRSPFLLETDPSEQRAATVEVNQAFNSLIWSTCLVMVGLSFACPTDQTFLYALNRDQDATPVGEATVYIVNPDRGALDEVSARVRAALPRSDVVPVEKGFDTFVEDGLTELVGTVLSAG